MINTIILTLALTDFIGSDKRPITFEDCPPLKITEMGNDSIPEIMNFPGYYPQKNIGIHELRATVDHSYWRLEHISPEGKISVYSGYEQNPFKRAAKMSQLMYNFMQAYKRACSNWA